MPISIQIEEDGIAILHGSGALRFEDAKESLLALWKTPGWAGRAVICDFREAGFDMASSGPRALGRFVLQNQPTPPPSKVGFVTGRDVDFGMARMFEAHRDDPATAFRVFRDYDDAVRWAKSPDPDPAKRAPGP